MHSKSARWFNTAWIATSNGVSAIKRKQMTLRQKADYYYNIMVRRHIREPYLVEKCRFSTPGDTTTWKPNRVMVDIPKATGFIGF